MRKTAIAGAVRAVIGCLVVPEVLLCALATAAAAEEATPDPVQAAARAAIEKANAYIELAKSTERAVESWERYQSWVDMKKGPTGKERYIDYGMYDLNDEGGRIKDARSAAAAPPADEVLDEHMLNYIAAYEAVAPLFNEGAAYYEQKGYEKDNAAKGQDLHKRMVPLATTFIAAREAMLADLRPFVRDVEGQEIAAIEKRDGRTAAWHVGRVLHEANRVLDVFPRVRPQPMSESALEAEMQALGPDTPGEKFDQLIAGVVPPKEIVLDVKRYSEALAAYEKAVVDLEGFKGEKPDDFDELKPMPRQLLKLFHAFEGPLVKSKGHDFEGGGQMAGQITEAYFSMFNTGNGMVGSELRFLP